MWQYKALNIHSQYKSYRQRTFMTTLLISSVHTSFLVHEAIEFPVFNLSIKHIDDQLSHINFFLLLPIYFRLCDYLSKIVYSFR